MGESYKRNGENFVEIAQITLRKIQPTRRKKKKATPQQNDMLFNVTHGSLCHESHFREMLNWSCTIFLLTLLRKGVISLLYLSF